MADITSGIVTSFSNTPQAQSDSYAFSTLTEDAADTDIFYLNVMANDLGGNAKTLWSLDNADSASTATKIYAPSDLLAQDTGGAGDSTPDTSLWGAKIWITADGKVAYQMTNASRSHFESLAAGEVGIDTFTYAIRLSNGALSWSTVTVQILGTNDAPTISAAEASGAVTEDATDPTLSDSGTITFDDIDLTDAHTTSVAAALGNTLGGVLTASVTDAATGAGDGTVTWTYTVANSATQYLGVGDSATESFTITISDGETGGTVDQLVTVTVTGTNDIPTISAAVDTGDVIEDVGVVAGELSDSGTITFDDIDLTDAHTTSVAAALGNTLGGVLTASVTDAATGAGDGTVTWAYTVANSATQYLGVGDSATESFTITISDGETGGTVDQLVTVTVTGTNDAPDIHLVTTDTASASLTETNAGLSTSGTLTVTDADLSDSVGLSVTLIVASGTTAGLGLTNAQLLAMLSVAPASSLATPGSTNNATWTFNSGTQAFDYLAAGQSLLLTYTVHGDDGHTGTDDQIVTITINGTADGPVAAPPVYNGADPNDFDTAGPGPAATFVVPGAPAINGDNIIVGTNGVDAVDAKSGADFVYGYGGDDNLAGGSGTDSIYGGAGNDTIDGGQDTDTIYGGSGNDTIQGGSEIDTIYGGSGNDTIQGDAASDVIVGGYGADILTGNAGNDTFRFLDTRDTGDTITDFASGDKIDFSNIDANPSTVLLNDAFAFAGNTSTLAAYSAIWFVNDNGTVGNTADDFTVIQVDTDGNIGTAEMELHLTGAISLVAGDFLL